MTAIVTCGFTRPGLAATRSLGRAQIPVAVAAPFRPALAMWSRHATSTLLVPDANLDARRFADSIANELSGRYATCALASTDAALWALSRWRDKLPVSARRILPPHASVARALDFTALHDLAKSIGISCVNMLRVEASDSVESVIKKAKKLRPPFLLRSLIPWIEREDGSRGIIENKVVENLDDLRAVFDSQFELTRSGCLIESRPKGQTLAYLAVCQDGVPFAEACQERLHEERPFSEIATLAKTIKMDKEVQQIARDLLLALSWRGPAKVEMIRLESGQLQLITIIGRLWGSVQLAVNAGIDVPLLCYRLAEGSARTSKLITGRAGVRMRWMMGDSRQAFGSLWLGLSSAYQPRVWMQAFQTAASAYRPEQISQKHWDVFDWTDPMPFFYELQHAMRSRAPSD